MTIVDNDGRDKTKLVPFKLDDNTVIRIEARQLVSDEAMDSYIAAQIPSFEDITGTIKSIAKSIIAVWNEVQPSKATAEFGIEVGVEPGSVTALLVKGSGKANIKITLEWDSTT
jgi:hypothetical protein